MDVSSSNAFQAIKGGDRAIFKQLFEMYFKKMTLFAEYFLLDRDEAEDVAQEVFVELWCKANTSPEISNLKSYLFVQIRNKCLNRIKHLHVEDKYKQWLMEAQLYAEVTDVEVDQKLLQQVYEVIEELPDQSKVIFRKCVIDGKKYKEVAEEMCISINTVNTQMKRAYKYIRARLGISFLVFLIML